MNLQPVKGDAYMQLIFPSRCSFGRRSGSASTALLKAAAIAALLVATFTPAFAADKAEAKKPGLMPGALVIPPSNYAVSTGTTAKTRLAHTNLRVLAPTTASPLEAPPQIGYAYETPASLACVYQLVTVTAGCNPSTLTANSTGGSQSIAIVDAYDDPNAPSDLAYFSDVFGLPFNFEKFNVVYENESQPYPDDSGGWELEESLDIEYAHAMAPNATLYLVEAQSNSYADLLLSVQIAANLVKCGQDEYNVSTGTYGTCPTTATGKGEISMSWGGGEWPGETAYDTYFSTPTNVVFVASSGDSAGAIYPSTSPYVISAGGTSNARSLATGNLVEQIAWSDAGSGNSFYEPIPTWQSSNAGIHALAGTHRATPDVSADANPYTGVWVYDSFPMDYFDWQIDPSNWWIVGGTSVASPTIAGIINASETHSGVFAASTTAEHTLLYTTDYGTAATYAADFTDVNYGACYFYAGHFSGTGWDECTGLGAFKGLAGK
jgi:subtilase family serine protease